VRKYEIRTEEEVTHYVTKIKEHEEKRLSTNKRNEYWRNYYENK